MSARVGITPLTGAERTRRWRAGKTKTRPIRGRLDEQLEVECYCHARVVLVPSRVVRDGRTVSCGRARCDELAKEATS